MKVNSWNEMQWEKVTDTISRKIITGANEMIAHVYLKKDAIVPEHSHLSEQITYVLEGALKMIVRGEDFVVRSGEVLIIPSNVPHSAIALEDTLDVDIFSPIRQDWLDHTDTYFQNSVEKE